MALSNRRWKVIGLATALSITGAASLAIAQGFDPWQDSPLMKSVSNYWAPNNQQPTLGQLANNEAIVVDLKSFNIAKAGAKGDTSSQIDKLHAREVADGAIIMRSGKQALHRGWQGSDQEVVGSKVA
jgi:hypothetical protein